ncbi:MAG: hypothetical protein A3I05_05470 [Deltaproteobacteria bacterium RIFCSPLOWO2_02_FULL_44_10]|nr:MAG: hypothetical protein A3C46_06220 [Deltaproteobacteria bacterium RIFCSPHIGHO2_02_FULL_44_16]OGQ46033.1 MAG: hypothetical protein A3I05_05470 [Deltaproteobacteria bacterium RIFCSPLOWO2_02_FULL_44_10]
MKRRHRSHLELTIIVIVVGLAVVLGIGLYQKRSEAQSARQLMRELSTFRSALALYKTMNHENPLRLENLIEKDYDFGDGKRRRFLDALPPIKAGEVLDPFGTPYTYDATSGWIKSKTEGYEKW